MGAYPREKPHSSYRLHGAPFFPPEADGAPFQRSLELSIPPLGGRLPVHRRHRGNFVIGLYFSGNGNDFPASRSTGTLKKYYDTILPISGQVLFYGYGTGDAWTGYLRNGQLMPESDRTLPLYTSLVVDQTYVVGYNEFSGKLDVYSLSTTGVLTLNSSTTVATYGFMVLTQS